MYVDTAFDIWNDLKERFSQTNAPNFFQLKQSITSLKQANNFVSVYFTLLKSLWDELDSLTYVQPCTCGTGSATTSRLQQDRAMEFLQGLHERFQAIRSQILLMDPFPNVTKIYSLVRQEEKQQEIQALSIPVPEAAALNITRLENKMDSRSRASNTKANRFGSYQKKGNGYDPRRGGKRPYCDHCKAFGHYRSTCYQLNGYPSQQLDPYVSQANNVNSEMVQPPMISPEQYNKLLAMLSSGSITPNSNLAGISLFSHSSSVWIVDSGATNHMCSSLSLFSSYHACSIVSSVKLPDGTDSPITHIGSVTISPTLQLQNVFYVPSFKFNLLSVSQLTKSHQYSVTFSDDSCVF